MIEMHAWAMKWQIPYAALHELQVMYGMVDTSAPVPDERPTPRSEAAVQAVVRIEATKAGDRLFRNNRGAGLMESGSFVRFGLANDTSAMDKIIKSGDLIGIHRRLIGPEDVGHIIGQFDSAEIKREGWVYSGTPEEIAQKRWADLVISMGGRARFIHREGMF